MSDIRILVVDDYEAWRLRARLLLQARPEWQVIGEALDGLEAVEKARDLKPDVILLDIGLPKLNGIEAARRIRQHSPNSKIVFLSADNSPDVLQEALSTGAQRYVCKARAQSDLLPAIEAVLRGGQFVSRNLEDYQVTDASSARTPHRHEVLFYSDDASFLDSCTRFIAAALKAGDVAVVLATESHRDSLIHGLKARGIDIDAEVRHGAYVALDVAKTLATFMVNEMPDPDRFFEVVGGFMRTSAKAGRRKNSRVVACGECSPYLWAEGNADAAIRLEQLWDQIVSTYEVDTLCGYALSGFHGEGDDHVYRNICAEHSAIYSQ